MRILYADTGLRGVEGHNASSAIALPPAFRRLGHEVTVLGHRDMVPSLQETTGATPLFRFYTWGTWSSDPLAGWLADFTEILDATLADLHSGWIEHGPFDFMYFNTVRPAQLAAIGLWLKETFPIRSAAPSIAVQLGPDPGLVRSGSQEAPIFAIRDPTTVLHRYAVQLAGEETIRRLALFAVNETVAEEYSFIVNSPVTSITTPEELPESRWRKPDGVLTIGFLGYQRIDKGYELLPDLIERLLQRHENVRFLVQHSDPQALAQDYPERNLAVTGKLRELAGRYPRRIELVLQPVVGNAWFALIDRYDMVILPYDPVRYASGYSAVFGEVLASGAPIVAPVGTTMSVELDRAGGAGVSFSQWSVPSVASAVSSAVDNFGALAERAYRGGLQWRTEHGPDAYVAQIMEGAGHSSATDAPGSTSMRGKLVIRKLPPAFLHSPQLQNGASIKLVNAPLPDKPVWNVRDFFKRKQRPATDRAVDVMNTVIETMPMPWHYSLTFEVDAEIVRGLPSQSQLIAEAIMEVDGGAVGISWINRENQLVPIEQVAMARAGTQRVTVSIPSDQAHRLVLRNAAPDGRKATFRLKGLSATAATLAKESRSPETSG